MSTKSFKDARKALDHVRTLYAKSTDYLRQGFDEFAEGKIPTKRVRATYPFIRIATENATRKDSRLSFGFVPRPGVYETTLTRPDIFDHYYEEQIEQLLENHGVPVEVGFSEKAIPIHFALGEDFYLEQDLSARFK